MKLGELHHERRGFMTRIIFVLASTIFVLAAPSLAQVPNYEQHVRACVAKFPAAWSCLNEERECKRDFVILCARDLQMFDRRVGLNGKRGDPANISGDILTFTGIGHRERDSRTGEPLTIVDIGFASEDPARRRVIWDDDVVGPGTWVDPFSVEPVAGGGSPPPRPPPPPPPADAYAALLAQIRDELVKLNAMVSRFFPQ